MSTIEPVENFDLDENMPLWDSQSLSEALDTEIPEGVTIKSVSIDSRTLKKSSLFVAIRGENLNGNEYAIDAIKNGATLCIVDEIPKGAAKHKAQMIVVKDTLKALNQLAKFARERIDGKIIGVTGSVGKTSTKEMLKVAFEHQGHVYASEGNFNNHYGMPLTLANMPENTDFGVIEMGMSSKGEIAHLSHIAKPDVAIITTIEAVHLEFFSSISGIAAAKSEIFDGMEPGGTAIINFDNPYHKILSSKAQQHGLNIVSFSEHTKSDLRLLNYRLQDGVPHAIAECYGKDISYTLGSIGKHQALNSLAVLAAVKACGGEIEFAARNLRNFESQQGRGKIHHINHKKITVIDDSYNAGPASIKAALQALSTHKNANRLIAILGDMKELGAQGPKLHLDLLIDVANNKIDKTHTVGELMHYLHEKLPEELQGEHANDSAQLAKKINDHVEPGDVILIKGSNSMKMNKILEALLK